MEKLSQTTFDHLRSWLSVDELHKFRRVSKAWENVENVDKVVHFGEIDIASSANVNRITHLTIDSLRGVFVEIRTIEELLLKNKSCLQSLTLEFEYGYGSALENIRVPQLPCVKRFKILFEDDEDGDGDLFCQKMIRAMPRLKSLDISSVYEFKILDFNDMKELKTIGINKDVGRLGTNGYQLKNADLGQLQEVLICAYPGYKLHDSILPIWIIGFPNIAFHFRFDFVLGQNFKIKECIWNKTVLKVKKIEASIDNFPVRDIAASLRALVQRFEAIRPGPLQVKGEFGASWSNTNEFAFKLVLSKMKEL